MRSAHSACDAEPMRAVKSSEAGPDAARAWLWWLSIGAAALITAAALWVLQVIILVKYGASCHDPVPLQSRHDGEMWLIVTASIATALWLFGVWFGTRHRRRLVFILVCTVVASAPGWFYVIYGLTPAHWSDGFCF